MDSLVAWLITTPGLITIGVVIILYIKRKKEAEEAEKKRKQLERKKSQKEKIVKITETKTTIIHNLDKETFEKISNRNMND